MCTNVRLTTSPFSVLDSFTLVVNVVGAFRDVRFFSWPIFHTIARIGLFAVPKIDAIGLV